MIFFLLTIFVSHLYKTYTREEEERY